MNFSQFATSDYEGAGFLFITPDKKILMLQKPNKKWSLVGGHREKGESPYQTARRETKEEIGFVPKGNIIDFVRYKKKEINIGCYSFIMKVSEEFEPQLSNEHIGYKWIPYKKINEYVISKAVKDILPYLKNINF